MKTKQFLQYANKLDQALEENSDIFFAQRPFLEDKSLEPKILSQSDADTERKIDNEILIEKLIKILV